MKQQLVLWWCLIVLLCSAAAAVAQSPFAPQVKGPLSQRVVAYQIDAKYDPPTHTVTATETLTYHNLTGQAARYLPIPSLSERLSAEGHLDSRSASRRQLPHQQPGDMETGRLWRQRGEFVRSRSAWAI